MNWGLCSAWARRRHAHAAARCRPCACGPPPFTPHAPTNANTPPPPPHEPGPEIWRQTGGKVTHIVSSMGTFGTIMGAGRYLKQRNPGVQVVGLQPSEAVQIPGIRRWT